MSGRLRVARGGGLGRGSSVTRPCYQVAMALLKWTLIVLVAGYLGVAGLMYWMQRSLMYFPDTERTPPAAAGLPAAEAVPLDTPDGERVIV
jgi:hypothetical protein